MTAVERVGEPTGAIDSTGHERAVVLEQLESLERSPGKPRWAWLLVVVGLLMVIGLGYHGYTAYTTIDAINVRSRIETPNPAALFQDMATTGPRVGSAVENSSRATYGKALEQYVLDGTGLLSGLALVVAGALVRINR